MKDKVTQLDQEPLGSSLDPTRVFLRWPHVEPMVGISRSHAHLLAREGKFPKPVKLAQGGRASAWIKSEVLDWIDERIASRSEDSMVA